MERSRDKEEKDMLRPVKVREKIGGRGCFSLAPKESNPGFSFYSLVARFLPDKSSMISCGWKAGPKVSMVPSEVLSPFLCFYELSSAWSFDFSFLFLTIHISIAFIILSAMNRKIQSI